MRGLSSLQAVLAMVLYHSSKPLGEKTLALLTDTSELAVQQALHALQQQRVVLINPTGEALLCGDLPDSVLNAFAHTLRQSGPALSLEYCLGRLAPDSGLDGCEQVVRHLDERLSSGRHDTLNCLDITLNCLLHWQDTHDSFMPNEHSHYVELVIVVQSMCLLLNRHLRTAVNLSAIAYNLTTVHGNARFRPIIVILRCYLRLFIDDDIADNILLFVEGVRELKSFDDRDMRDVVPYFEGILHFVRGEFHKVIECYERRPDIQDWKYHRLDDMLAFCVSMSAIHQRRYPLALGICTSARNTASLAGDRLQAMFWQLHIVFTLLRKGDLEAALENADTLLLAVSHRFNNKIAASAVRAIAIMHYFNGRLASTYHLLHNETMLAISQDIPHSPFEDPLNLDMLFALEQAGFPPVPRYELDTLLPRLRTAPNRQMCSAALRIQALRGAPTQQAVKLLRESLKLARQIQDHREQVLAGYELVKMLKQVGPAEEAQELWLEVIARLGEAPAIDLPRHELVLLATCGHTASTPFGLSAQSIVERCAAAMRSLPIGDTLDAMLGQFTRAAQMGLDAERAILLQPGETLKCVAAVNFTHAEQESATMRPLLRWIEQRGSDSLPYASHDNGMGLVLSLQVDNGRPWQLYLSNSHTSGDYLGLTDVEWRELALLFAAEIRSLLRLHKVCKEAARTQQAHVQAVTQQDDRNMPPLLGVGLAGIMEQIHRVAATDAAVLLLGETGVGKEVMARRIHHSSQRGGAFVAVHPASTPESLFESEFFGHEKGAFTGAVRQKIGLIEMADEGTLFIDEVGDIPLSIQTRLLRVLQEQCFRRVGGTRTLYSRFRLVAATNKNLAQEVREGHFREDLLYRISVVPLTIPPLRQRRDDILPLVEALHAHFCRRYNRSVTTLSPQQRAGLYSYEWPGNVREMKNMIERAVILNDFLDLPGVGASVKSASDEKNVHREVIDMLSDTPTLCQLEERYLRYILKRTSGRVRGPEGAETLLHIKRSTLYTKLKKLGIPCGNVYSDMH